MLVIDIETVPLAQSLTVPFDRATAQPPANYKSPDAIAKWLDGAEAEYATKRVKECSVNPRLGRVLCIGFDHGTHTDVLTATTEDDESRILWEFWSLAAECGAPYVTWNGAFDLRYLIIRSIVHGLNPSVDTTSWFTRKLHPHFDCKAALMNWEVRVAGEGLDEWAQALDIIGKSDGWDGSKVYSAYVDGRCDDIAAYCRQDVVVTAAIYDRIKGWF